MKPFLERKVKKIIIYGIGAVAKSIYHDITHFAKKSVEAFIVDRDVIEDTELFGLPVVPYDKMQEEYPQEEFKVFLAVGYMKVNKFRENKYHDIKRMGYDFINVIHQSVVQYPDISIGDNCLICPGTVIFNDVKIGNNVFIGAGVTIGHDVEIGDNCFISSSAAISGYVTIGKNCFLGTNATIRNKVNLGVETVISAGSIVLETTNERSVYLSDPATPLSVTSDKLSII